MKPGSVGIFNFYDDTDNNNDNRYMCVVFILPPICKVWTCLDWGEVVWLSNARCLIPPECNHKQVANFCNIYIPRSGNNTGLYRVSSVKPCTAITPRNRCDLYVAVRWPNHKLLEAAIYKMYSYTPFLPSFLTCFTILLTSFGGKGPYLSRWLVANPSSDGLRAMNPPTLDLEASCD